MTRLQRKALKLRLRSNLHFQKNEIKKWSWMASHLHLKRDRYFKTAFTNLKKEYRLFQRLNSKIR